MRDGSRPLRLDEVHEIDAAEPEGETAWLDGLRYAMTFDESALDDGLAENDTTETAQPPHPSVGAGALRDLVWRANHDSLTGVANREWFVRSADASRLSLPNRGHQHALVLIDLDGFKAINDTWGHSAGDCVLVAIAERLRGISRSGDVVGRLGGDEFALWAERARPSDVTPIAHRVMGIFSDPVHFGEAKIPIAGSLGVVIVSQDSPIADVLASADAALYDAKRRPADSFCVFDDALEARLTETSQREREVVEAIDTEAFDFDIQPIVNLSTGRSVGVELLARWNSPRQGRLMPSEFLPIISDLNLFGRFDEMVLHRAGGQLQNWRTRLRPPSSIWVNISPTQLRADFPDFLGAILEKFHISAGELVLELTEDAEANTPGRMAVLEAVRSLGVEIAIDDFGTGYSQLAYLQDMPIDYVKLDRSLVSAFYTEPRRVAITKSIVLLAQAIGAKVIAEGVEREAELELLTELGCDYAQGYLLARPGNPIDLLGN